MNDCVRRLRGVNSAAIRRVDCSPVRPTKTLCNRTMPPKYRRQYPGGDPGQRLTCQEQIGLRQLGIDGVLGTRVADAESETEQAEEPAYGALRPAGGHDSAHSREEYGAKRIL